MFSYQKITKVEILTKSYQIAFRSPNTKYRRENKQMICFCVCIKLLCSFWKTHVGIRRVSQAEISIAKQRDGIEHQHVSRQRQRTIRCPENLSVLFFRFVYCLA